MGPENWAVLRFWITTFPHGTWHLSYCTSRPFSSPKGSDPTIVAGGPRQRQQSASKAQPTNDNPHTTSIHILDDNFNTFNRYQPVLVDEEDGAHQSG
jgi:hypothetical protein